VRTLRDALGVIADALAVLGVIGLIAIAVLKRSHIAHPGGDVQLLIAAVSLGIVGVGALVVGLVTRQDVFRVFEPDRGGGTVIVMVIGVVLIALALAGLLAL
jgi:Kef-type K+ transport system membrane component KefB